MPKAELDIMLIRPILRAVSSVVHADLGYNYQHEVAIAATPKIDKKAYTPIYMAMCAFTSVSLASAHQSIHTAVVS
jgi:hypothetical protein